MRVTIKIDDQNVSVSQSSSDEQSPSSGATAGDVEPPAELAARAEALGALSAGSAPVQPPGSSDPGAPGITVQSAEADAAVAPTTDAVAAGAAPGQLDQTESVEEPAEESP
jgi:hypothetical protein